MLLSFNFIFYYMVHAIVIQDLEWIFIQWDAFKDWSTLFCLHWEMKGHWSRQVKLVKQEALLKDLHATSVLAFPNANKTRVSVETGRSTGLFLFINLQTFKSQKDINRSCWMISNENEE